MTIEANPRDFARQVHGASDAELEQLARESEGTSLLDGIFAGMPDVFRADRAAGVEAVVHWHVLGPGDAEGVYQVTISDGTCVTTPGTTGPARLTLRLDIANFLRMTTGNAAAWTLFLRGRLKARGDLGLARTFPQYFDVPKV
ncbi:hypothetical protein GCM10010168_45340 [Actinoplanes ianthinogenes]|uniref:SCP2 domain-containing protein n=1 Tax=Actinoplanes ianthinogenes TaxID=122358 RepID=A0ABN6C9K5_9ACTN|nr:SCP2 sterol-binding domain-containing protein [Actinoplanes ianthinogenes]BCJ41168.1 hypothetical protein Aiant_18250 [Actinoplanes ianthinogenes]GGR22447.1 hypothetical protein GCM10010168_45340 [Actinoplanes ianthinogenes]